MHANPTGILYNPPLTRNGTRSREIEGGVFPPLLPFPLPSLADPLPF